MLLLGGVKGGKTGRDIGRAKEREKTWETFVGH